MKSIMKTLTTTSAPNVEVDLSKLLSKKGLNISDGGSSSSIAKPISTVDTNEK